MKTLDDSFIEMLKSTDLFCGVDSGVLSGMLLDSRAEVAGFAGGQVIYSRNQYRRSLGLLLKGKAEVRKTSGGHTVILNRLTAPRLFGAAVLYQDEEEYVAEIVALEPCTILFLTQDLFTETMRRDFTLTENYLAFLSQRIRFLNRKIDGFTRGSAESKLAWYLLDISCGETSVCFPVSLKHLAEVLNLGRASLYRALDALADSDLIERDGKQIRIVDKTGLQDLCR